MRLKAKHYKANSTAIKVIENTAITSEKHYIHDPIQKVFFVTKPLIELICLDLDQDSLPELIFNGHIRYLYWSYQLSLLHYISIGNLSCTKRLAIRCFSELCIVEVKIKIN